MIIRSMQTIAFLILAFTTTSIFSAEVTNEDPVENPKEQQVEPSRQTEESETIPGNRVSGTREPRDPFFALRTAVMRGTSQQYGTLVEK